MAKLTTQERKDLPQSAFAVKGGHYPIEDRNHAKAALSMVSRYGSPEEQATVRAKVRARYPDIDQGNQPEGRKKVAQAMMGAKK